MINNDNIGLVGLGAMGGLMSKHLINEGFNVHVYDVSRNTVAEVEKKGAIGHKSPKEVAENSKHIVCMLPNPYIVREVILGEQGVIEGIQENSVVIDMGTVGPTVEIECADRLKDKKANLIDAPVGKGVWAAGKGELTIFVGGVKKTIKSVEYILSTLGKEIIYCGCLGSGQVVKLANNIASCVNIATISELLKLARENGIEIDILKKALTGTAADSWHLQNSLPRIKNEEFSPANFKTKLAHKDLKLVTNLGEEISADMPMTEAAIKYYDKAIEMGHGEMDW